MTACTRRAHGLLAGRAAAATHVMRNLRNHYRLLHVAPDAPLAVIKGSYRTMMQTLRHHPDLGGDEWNAQLLNEAMRVLGDGAARARYDATLGLDPARARTSTVPFPEAPEDTPSAPRDDVSEPSGASVARDTSRSGDERAGADDPITPAPAADTPSGRCPFCGLAARSATGVRSRPGGYAIDAGTAATRCVRCGAPRCPPVIPALRRESGERRGIARVVRRSSASVRRHAPNAQPADVILREFSVAGAALEAPFAMSVGEVVLLDADLLSAVAAVVSVRGGEPGASWRIGLAFLGVELHATPGSVFSGTA